MTGPGVARNQAHMPGQSESNHEYLIRRATEEELAATGAVHPLAREAHLEMAKRYRDACRGSAEVNAAIRTVR